jgi:uncharacterized protein (TIGR03435 family)
MILKYLSAVSVAIAPAMANHLWQSTLFAVLAGALALALRKNQARVRYSVWLAASVKFLIPFSLLTSLGGHLTRPRGSVSLQSGLYSVVEQFSQPFTRTAARVVVPVAHVASASYLVPLLQGALAVVWMCGFLVTFSLWWSRWRRISAAMRAAVPMSQGREVNALRRMEQTAGVRTPIVFLFSSDSLEPGIFGIGKPILVWPAGISEHLTDAHLQAIIAHEVWHVRRRDNLAAAAHMVVEAIFWFHPLVWWLGARLVEERERACDEEVLQLGNEPRVYAESILKTCEFCVRSPLACVPGVTGANLKKRIVRVMTESIGQELDLTHKLLLITTGLMALAVPLSFGLVHANQSRADSQTENTTAKLPAFEVASIKPDKAAGDGPVMLQFTPDGFTATNMPLKMLIREAYSVEENQILGAPAWLNAHSYDIEAKVDSAEVGDLRNLSIAQRKLMLQPLLVDRFKLQIHRETKELPVYELLIGKNGPKVHEAKPNDTYPNGIKGPDGHSGPGLVWIEAGRLTGQGVPLAELARLLSQRLGHNVLDKTGLTGKYDFIMPWPPADAADTMPPVSAGGEQGAAAPPDGPSIFTALQEQLGLRLESRKAPVEVLVIDHVETPSAN